MRGSGSSNRDEKNLFFIVLKSDFFHTSLIYVWPRKSGFDLTLNFNLKFINSTLLIFLSQEQNSELEILPKIKSSNKKR